MDNQYFENMAEMAFIMALDSIKDKMSKNSQDYEEALNENNTIKIAAINCEDIMLQAYYTEFHNILHEKYNICYE